MLFRRLFSTRTRSLQSPSAPSNASSPSTSAHPEPAAAPHPSYPDYLNENGGLGWDAALVMSFIIRDMPTLPRALFDPLTQVFDIMAEVIEAVKTMRDGRDGCTQLILRATKFLEGFVSGLKGSSVIDNTAVASSLFILRRNLMAICADAKRWSSLNLWRSYIQRNQIMTAILRHEVNLTDCFHTFQAAILLEGLRNLLEHPMGQAVSEQIDVAVQARLEEMGLSVTSTSLSARSVWRDVSPPLKSKRQREREAAATAAASATGLAPPADVHFPWESWRPDPSYAPSPAPTEQLIVIQDEQMGWLGLFGPRSSHSSWASL